MSKSELSVSRWVSWIIPIVAIYVVFNIGFWKRPEKVISWDIVSYYAYLPASFIYNDLSLAFVDDYKGEHHFIIWAEKGRPIKTSMGLSMLYAPFFFIAHPWALLAGEDAGGYSWPYSLMLVLSCVFYLWLGLFYLRKLLLRYYSEKVTASVLVAVVFGTGLFYYSTAYAPMPHTYNFALFAIFIHLTMKWYQNPRLKETVLTGLLLGLITLIRPTNILIGLIFLFWNVVDLASLRARFTFLFSKLPALLTMGFFAALVWLPQFAYWKHVTGSWLYYSYGNERFYFLSFNFLKGLFSFRNGWLVYSPVMILALFGVLFLRRYARELLVPVLLFSSLNIYLLLSWWCWWYTGFGNRAMIDSGAVLAFPLAAYLTYGSDKEKILPRMLMVGIFVLFTIRGAFHTVQYHYNALHYNSGTINSFWHNFFRVKPDQKYWELLREPDYDKAVLGVDAYLDQRNEGKNLIFDLESLSDAGDTVFANVPDVFLKLDFKLDTLNSHSGTNSAILDSSAPYAMLYTWTVYNREKYQVSVWTKQDEGASAGIVVSDEIGNTCFYELDNRYASSGGGWQQQKIHFEVPPCMHNSTLRVYVHHPGPGRSFFDDLSIRRLDTQPLPQHF